MDLSFEQVLIIGEIVVENELYKHYHYPEMLSRYDSNFIQFKKMPSLEQFQQVEEYLRTYHKKRGQKFLKFCFPEDEVLYPSLKSYMERKQYDVYFVELYGMYAKQFPKIQVSEDIHIEKVTDHNLEIYLDLQYKDDLEYGEVFAREQKELTKRLFNVGDIEPLLAFYRGKPTGYMEMIVREKTVEMNNLTVQPSVRHRGIGSHLQSYMMDLHRSKYIMLVADGEDTPREMYQKQGYNYRHLQYEALWTVD